MGRGVKTMSEDKIFHIGVMIGNVHTKHPTELIRGICEAAKTENVNISFFVGAQGSAMEYWNEDENDIKSYNYQYNSLYDYSLIAGLDAIIISYGTLCIYLDQEDRETFAKKYRDVPLVILEEYDEQSVDSFIISDNYGSMFTIMEHLLSDHGYKKIIYLSGPKNNTDSNERERAYIEAMRKHGLTVTSDMVEYGDYSSNVDDLVERLLDNNPYAEAIVSANDEMAVSIYRVCLKRGLVPGKDIAVTGYDDVEFAQRMDPPLTTANQDGLDMGYRALKCAVSLCKDSTPVKMRIPAQFKCRYSCGCNIKDAVDGWSLPDMLENIKDSQDKENIEAVINSAVNSSYLSVVSEDTREKGKAYFSFLIDNLFQLYESKDNSFNKDLAERSLAEIQKLYSMDGGENLDFSGFIRVFHQIISYFMGIINDSEKQVVLGFILQITDTYINSFVMRIDEDRISFLLNKSWEAPASIRYMVEKVDDENAFNRMALETAVSQGAKSAYLYLLPEPLKCDRKEQFKCPEKLELVAEYVADEVKVYDKDKRPVVTKDEGFAFYYPPSSKHNYVVFLIYAKEYQYGLMLCEIDDASIGLLYGVALQISTAKAYMQISQQENEAKQQLYDTLKELKDKNKVLSFVSSTDELTGLYNRRGFMENAVKEVSNHIGSRAAIFFSDLDHLKEVNDEFGHSDGDYALVHAAEIMKETFENFSTECTICSRVGGDEFITFMICDDELDTDDVVKALNENIRKFNEKCVKPYFVEFSTGCVTFICSEDYSVAELTSQADECLYEAKKSRRKSIVK